MSESDGQRQEARLSPRLLTGLIVALVAVAFSISLAMVAVGGYMNAHAALVARQAAVTRLERTAAAAKHQALAYKKDGTLAKALISAAPALTQGVAKAAAKVSLPSATLAAPEDAASVSKLLDNVTTLVPVLQQAALLEANYLAARPDMLPVHGVLTSGYGWRVNPLTKNGMEFHHGFDLGVPIGTPVRAVGAGTIVYAKWGTGRYFGYGNFVVLDNGFGITTIYAHNSKILVKVGQHVVRGQVISLSGSTGMSTGPHVHFGILVNGVPVNPGLFIAVPPLQAFKAWLAANESGLVAEWTARVRIAAAPKATTTLDHSTAPLRPLVQSPALALP